MAYAVWPSNFQQRMDGNTFVESEDSQIVSTAMYAGPGKTRRVVTRAFKRVVCSMLLTHSQYLEFKTWWDNEIGGGTNPFYFPHPILSTMETPVMVAYRFYQVYKMQSLGGMHLRINMEWLEVE